LILQPKIISKVPHKEKKMSGITRREFLRVSSVAVGAAVLAACKPGETVAPAGEEGTTGEKPAEEVKRPTTWPLGDVPRNRTLIYQYGAPAPGVHHPLLTGFNHQIGNAILFEPCAFYGAHADKTYMWLAESYKYNDTATEMTIVFRKGIKWSDGTAFTAKDVATSMERLKRVDGLNRSATYKAEMDAVEVVDDVTLKLKLNQPDWRFFFKSLTFRFDLGDDTAVLPDHLFKDVPDAELISTQLYDVTKGWPVSTGPYGVGTESDQFVNFDLRPTWWAVESGFVEAYPDVWRLLHQAFQNDTNAAQSLVNNEIDQSLDLRPLITVSLLAQSDHVACWDNKPPYGYTDWWPISVQFCTAKPPWDNPKVRWAVAYALNQQQLVDVGWGGAGKVAYGPFPEFKKLDEYMAGIKDLTDKYNVLEVNLDKSAALMTEAGFAKNADGWWADKDGVVPDSDLYAAVPLFGDIGPIVAEQLRAAGFKCEHKAPQDVWAAKVDGRASMFLFGHGGSTVDPLDTFLLYQKVNAQVPMGEQNWSNITRWWNDDFEALRAEMNNTPMDDPKMKDLFHKMMEIYYTELPDCPIVQWFHRIPVNTTYWTNWPTAANPYMNSALWHQTMLQVVLGLKATNA
jgi:peptide/nickel transport system substrate-binding protein